MECVAAIAFCGMVSSNKTMYKSSSRSRQTEIILAVEVAPSGLVYTTCMPSVNPGSNTLGCGSERFALALFAQGGVENTHPDQALSRLNDTKVAHGQGHKARAVVQVWGFRRCRQAP